MYDSCTGFCSCIILQFKPLIHLDFREVSSHHHHIIRFSMYVQQYIHLLTPRATSSLLFPSPTLHVIAAQEVPRGTPTHLRPETCSKQTTMRSASALFFAALGGAAFSLGADAAGGFFASSSGAAARPRGFLPGWGLPRHESVFDRVSLIDCYIDRRSICNHNMATAAVAAVVVVMCFCCSVSVAGWLMEKGACPGCLSARYRMCWLGC